MKCRKLIVQNLKSGSPWPVMECGGAYVDNGDSIIVREDVAKRFMVQHGPYLMDGGELERDSLAGGHYAIEKAGGESEKPKRRKKAEEPKPEPEETPADKSDDKSMLGRTRRRRKKAE